MDTPHVRAYPFVLALLLGLAGGAPAQVQNGSFETGDFTGWTATDMADPLTPLQVAELGSIGYFGTNNEPTDGEFSVVNGFDGGGPDVILLTQDVHVPASTRMLLVDFMAQWDLLTVVQNSALDRTFRVVVQTEDGVSELADFELLRAPAQTVDLDGDRYTAAVSLASFKNQTVQLGLLWDVPEVFTGPAFFDLDHVRLAGRKVPVVERASLKLGFDFAKAEHDSLKMELVVPVPPGFDPDGEGVTVSVGELVKEFTLNPDGTAHVDGDLLKLLPVGAQDGYRKLRLISKQGDLAADFEAHGLFDEDTGGTGLTVAVPVSVELAGETTSRTFTAVYKAVEGATGKAKARPVSDAWATSLTVGLDYSVADEDSIKLKTAAFVAPGFAPEGVEVTVDIGGVGKTFTLDPDGTALDGNDSIALARDPRNPARQTLSLHCTLGNFQDVDPDFMPDEDTPPGGLDLVVPVTVTLDGRATRTLVPVTFKAKEGQSGKAKS